MDPEELKRRYAPRVLQTQIRGQRMFPTRDRRSFEYGGFEELYPWMKFEFVYSFGGFSGALLQEPGERVAWIKSLGHDPMFWKVRRQDLDGNYSEIEETR